MLVMSQNEENHLLMHSELHIQHPSDPSIPSNLLTPHRLSYPHPAHPFTANSPTADLKGGQQCLPLFDARILPPSRPS